MCLIPSICDGGCGESAVSLLCVSISSKRDAILGRQSSGLLPSVALPGPFLRIRSLIGNILSPLSLLWIARSNPCEENHLTNFTDTDIAELLWMAKKMQNCGVMEWSSVPALVELSLCACPKVQKSLVRLSALLCTGLVGKTTIPQEVCLQLILLWLSLLCNATHGGDGPIFSTEEKKEAEKQLERLVAALPETDQEQVLSTWLQEYAQSRSDFPNLQKCYNNWYCSKRKLEVGMAKIMND